MSRCRAPLLGLVLAGGPAMAAAQDPHVDSLRSQVIRSWVGEQLSYEVKFGLLRLGTAEIAVPGIDSIQDIEALHIVFTLQGGTFFYRLNNRMDSWLGIEDLATRRFVQDFDEGGQQRRNVYDIYPDSGFYRQEGVDSVTATSALPLDDASFFYFVRTVDLEPGTRHEFNRYFKPDRNPVVLEVVERDTIDVPAGRFATVVVRPIIRGGGIFKEGADGRMWITDDPRRLVVQIKSRFYFGNITMRLTDISGSTTEAPE